MRENIEQLIENLEDFPSLPGTVIKVIEMTSDPKLSMKSLAKVISTDAAMTARILKMVNSPYYGLSKRIDKIENAVTYLGSDSICSLALSLSLVDTFPIKETGEYANLFKFSLTSAICADIISESNHVGDRSKIFLAALLQNIGMYIFLRHLRRDYIKLVKKARKRSIRLSILEKDKYQIDHIELGQMLARKWNLPLYVSVAMQYRENIDDLENSDLSVEYKQIVKCSYLAYYASYVYNNWNRYYYLLKIREYYKFFFPDSTNKIDNILMTIPDKYQQFMSDYQIEIPLIPAFKDVKNEIQKEFLLSQDIYEQSYQELLISRKIVHSQEEKINKLEKQLLNSKRMIQQLIRRGNHHLKS